MSTLDILLDNIKIHQHWDIQTDSLWPTFKKTVESTKCKSGDFLDSFYKLYPSMPAKTPELLAIADAFFFGTVLLEISYDKEFGRLNDRVGSVFKLWTLNGSRSISEDHIIALAVHLENILLSTSEPYQYNKMNQHKYVHNMLYASPQLWSILEAHQGLLKNPLFEASHTKSIELFHRYAPDTVILNRLELEESYLKMAGWHTNLESSLLDMRRILTGSHANALAWAVALTVCTPPKHPNGEHWIKMLDTFSSLTLETKDQDAWRFWHLLCDSTKDDASGRTLMVELSKAKPSMSKAFSDEWSLIDTIEEGDLRYTLAAQTHCSASILLRLPDMTEHYLP